MDIWYSLHMVAELEYLYDIEGYDETDENNIIFNKYYKSMTIRYLSIDELINLLNKYINRAYERKIYRFTYEIGQFVGQRGGFYQAGREISKVTIYPKSDRQAREKWSR